MQMQLKYINAELCIEIYGFSNPQTENHLTGEEQTAGITSNVMQMTYSESLDTLTCSHSQTHTNGDNTLHSGCFGPFLYSCHCVSGLQSRRKTSFLPYSNFCLSPSFMSTSLTLPYVPSSQRCICFSCLSVSASRKLKWHVHQHLLPILFFRLRVAERMAGLHSPVNVSTLVIHLGETMSHTWVHGGITHFIQIKHIQATISLTLVGLFSILKQDILLSQFPFGNFNLLYKNKVLWHHKFGM